jgi:DNA helicase-2/ATP-dependent DNA helicase PcrA
MKFIADLHVHSHFSRATSRDLIPERLALWAQKKGIQVIGTGDFTHPGWLAELKEKLLEAEEGLYRLKPELEKRVEVEVPRACRRPPRFLLSGEISCIYKRADRTRKIHHLVLLPTFAAVEALQRRLDRIGNITSDGRPILGLDSRDLLEIVLEVSERAFFIPAHVWTPWFSLFGSKSGFDTLEECFGDLSSHIKALETGLSSDPPMNRRLSALDDYLLVSNSDAHSPQKLGREANVFTTELGYDRLVAAMSHGNGFEGTLEFFPQEGKYHYDGHRKCHIRLHPQETRASQGRCPACGKATTVGVLHRTLELSDRETPHISKRFTSLIPLPEILSELLTCGPATKKVTSAYEELLAGLGPEFHILLEAPLDEIEEAGGFLLAKAIDRMRRNRVICEEGYDGEYGVIRLFDQAEKDVLLGQMALFQAPKSERAGLDQTRVTGVRAVPSKRGRKDQERVIPSDPILDPLNPAQREVVLHGHGHLLVVAGPGTGKTMTLTHRMAILIKTGGAKPDQILALTFTNKAAREMETRLSALLPREYKEVQVATFHSFCLELLRAEAAESGLPPDFNLCSELDVPLLIRRVVADGGKPKQTAARLARALPDLKKASVLENKEEGSSSDDLHLLFSAYQTALRRLGMLDLDDLEVEALRLLKDRPDVARNSGRHLPWIFVDEYQDTNSVQVELLKAIVGAGPAEVCAIGDPDQAIYGFRGAEVHNFHRFGEDFPGAKTIALADNYRSSQSILDASATLMGKPDALEGHSGKGDPIEVTDCGSHAEEAEMIVEQIERLIGGTSYFSLDSGRVSSHEEGEHISFGDIGVLFRLNAQGDALEEALARAGIPLVRSGEKPLVSRFPADVIWRFLGASQHSERGYHLERYLEMPAMKERDGKAILKRFEPEGTLAARIDQALELHEFGELSEQELNAMARLRRFAAHFDGDTKAFLDALSLDRGIDHQGLSGDRIALMSLHAAKGLEWPVVFISGCEDGLLPCTLFGEHDDDEERRLFYVGMTRARSRLILSRAGHRVLNGRNLQMKPSPFLKLIPEHLCTPLERTPWKRRSKKHQQLALF